MQLLKVVIVSVLLGSTVFAGFATFRNVGAQEIEHPEGISIRQESVQTRRSGFFPYYARSRAHRGGGLAGGK